MVIIHRVLKDSGCVLQSPVLVAVDVLAYIVESDDITSRKWWMARMISASGLIIADGVPRGLLLSFTALSLSHQC